MAEGKGKVILIAGQRGCGKTTKVRELITPVNKEALLLHDVGGQFSDIYNKPPLKFSEFTEKCTKVYEHCIVFEEATIFVGHSRNPEVVDFLVTSRYRNNTIIFVFHSMRSIPRYIWDLSNYLILFKTKDDLPFVSDRFDNKGLNEVFIKVQQNTNNHFNAFFEI